MNKTKYIAIECPVCHEYYFSELTEEDIKDGDDGTGRICHVCGWKYNVEQIEDPNIKNNDGYNIFELNNLFMNLRSKNSKYNYLNSIAPKPVKHICPVCKNYVFKDKDDHDICPSCGWENDLYGELNPNSDGGANSISLNEAILNWNNNHNK